MKMITITGIERCDFAYHVAKILKSQAENVICIDNSKSHELIRAVSGGNDKDNVERGGITFLKDVAYSPDFYNSFDYVVVYDGLRYRKDDTENSSYVFAMPDYRPETMTAMIGLPDHTEYIMRDAAGKVSERTAAQYMQVDEERIVGSLPCDGGDYGCYLSLIYNGRQKLNGLSPEYMDGLAYVCARVLEINEKQAMAMLKKVRKS